MDILVLVLLCLCAVSSTAYDPDGTRCEPEKGAPTCVCNYQQHGTVDLTKLANMDGTPRFTGLKDLNGYEYDYNPCSSFRAPDACRDVQACQISLDGMTFAIADNGTEQMWLGKDGVPYVYYTGSDGRETIVYLICEPSAKEPIVSAKGDTEIILRYVFTLVSKHACFARGSAGKCKPVSGAKSCVCEHPDGIIDLTKIANADGTPRYTGLKRGPTSSISYDYNPCAPFIANNCTNVQGCQSISYGNGSKVHNGIADYHTEQIWIRENSTTYIHYTGPNQREVNVSLICDQSVEDAIVAVTGEGALTYEFTLTSCYACPGGCKSKHWQHKIN